MKSAVIITTDKYPNGDAGAVRQHAFAKILQSLNYQVLVLGYGNSANGMKGNYEGVDYVTFRPNTNKFVVRMIYRLLSNMRIMHYLRHLKQQPDVLLVVDVSNNTYRALVRHAKKHGCVLVHDSVEWYSAEEYKNGAHNRTYRAKDKLNGKIMDHKWRVIAISQYLYEHFGQKCKKVVRIPVIMDMIQSDYRIEPLQPNMKLRFVYAGAPNGKDYLAQLLEGFSLVEPELREKIEIRIVGVTKVQLLKECGVSEKVMEALNGCLTALGRVPRETAVQEVMEADFSMLLRDSSLRYAQAGFPTKIVESLMCGTPPFCNLSSDLDLYLRDGGNAVLIDGNTPEDVKNAVEKALTIESEQRIQMRRNARQTAENSFDYRKYVATVETVLN